MAKFSAFSEKNLASLHPDLQLIHRRAIERIDYRIQEGHRGEGRQTLAVKKGFSKVGYPYSSHNTYPSLASDIVPWPFDYSSEAYNRKDLFKVVIDIIKEEAEKLGIKIRCGIDWGWDSPHVEIISKDGVPYTRHYLKIDP